MNRISLSLPLKEFSIGKNIQIKLLPKPSVGIYYGNQVNVISMLRFLVEFLNYFPANRE